MLGVSRDRLGYSAVTSCSESLIALRRRHHIYYSHFVCSVGQEEALLRTATGVTRLTEALPSCGYTVWNPQAQSAGQLVRRNGSCASKPYFPSKVTDNTDPHVLISVCSHGSNFEGPGKYGGANGIFPEPAFLCRQPECTPAAHLSASRPIGQESLLTGQHSCRSSLGFRPP